jgi:hypothetical protein
MAVMKVHSPIRKLGKSNHLEEDFGGVGIGTPSQQTGQEAQERPPGTWKTNAISVFYR